MVITLDIMGIVTIITHGTGNWDTVYLVHVPVFREERSVFPVQHSRHTAFFVDKNIVRDKVAMSKVNFMVIGQTRP